MKDNVLGNRAEEEPVGWAVPMRSHDNQVRSPNFRRFHNHFLWRTFESFAAHFQVGSALADFVGRFVYIMGSSIPFLLKRLEMCRCASECRIECWNVGKWMNN